MNSNPNSDDAVKTLRVEKQTTAELRRSGTNALTAFFARSLQQIAQFFVTLLAARFLLPAEYGIYTLAVVFVSLAQTLTYTGVFHFIVSHKGEERIVLDTSFWMIAGLGVGGAAVLALAAPFIADLYDAPDLKQVLWLLALIQPFAAYGAWASAVLLRRNRMQLHFGIMIAQNLLALVGGVALLVSWKSLFALVIFRYVRVISGAVLYIFAGRLWPGFRFRASVASEALRYASALYGTRFLNFLSNYGADLVLGLAFSTAEAGLYRFGNRLASAAVDIVAQPMRSFAISQFGAANRSNEPFGPLLQRFYGAMLLLTGIVAASVVVLADDAVNVLFQPSYAAALGVVYALAIRAVLGLGNSMVEPVLSAKGHTHAVMRHHLIWTIVQMAAITLLVPFGLVPLAFGQAAVIAAASMAGFALISKRVNAPFRPVGMTLGATAALVLTFGVVSWSIISFASLDDPIMLSGLLIEGAVLGLVVLVALLVAYRLRLLDLRVFGG